MVPLYVGLGASGGSYLKDLFYINTFSVREYIHAFEDFFSIGYINKLWGMARALPWPEKIIL